MPSLDSLLHSIAKRLSQCEVAAAERDTQWEAFTLPAARLPQRQEFRPLCNDVNFSAPYPVITFPNRVATLKQILADGSFPTPSGFTWCHGLATAFSGMPSGVREKLRTAKLPHSVPLSHSLCAGQSHTADTAGRVPTNSDLSPPLPEWKRLQSLQNGHRLSPRFLRKQKAPASDSRQSRHDSAVPTSQQPHAAWQASLPLRCYRLRFLPRLR